MTEAELVKLEVHVSSLHESLRDPVVKLIRHYRNLKLQKWIAASGLGRCKIVGRSAAITLERMRAVEDELKMTEKKQ